MAKEYRGGIATEKEAGEALGGNRVVAIVGDQAFYADKDTSAHWNKVRGITVAAYNLGETACIQFRGPMIEPSWSWTPDEPVFLGSNGLLTQTAPATGAVIQIGVADSATEININIHRPIIR